MHSLDQVIYFLEQRQQTEDWNIRDAAIEYLKAYRNDRDDLTALRAYWAEQQANPPLTWDELKTMEGKPVWIETKRYGSRWYLVEDNTYEDMIVFTGLYGEIAPYFQEDFGKTWQAYKKER